MSCCIFKNQRVEPEDCAAETTVKEKGCKWWTPRMAPTQEGHNDVEQSQGAGHGEVEDTDDDQFEDCSEEEFIQADEDQSESDRQNEGKQDGDQCGRYKADIQRAHTLEEQQEDEESGRNLKTNVQDAEQQQEDSQRQKKGNGVTKWEALVQDAEQREGIQRQEEGKEVRKWEAKVHAEQQEESRLEENTQLEEWWDADEFDQKPGKREGRDIEQDLQDQTCAQQVERNATIDEIKSKNHEVVILVASGEEDYKDGIIRSIIKKGCGTWRPEDPREDVTPGQTRILSRSNPPRKIIDTTLLRQEFQRSPTAIARKWISHNMLRRLIVNKYVVGVVVITPSVLNEPCTKDMLGHENCWLDVMRIVFGKYKHGFMFIVKHEGNIDESTKKDLRYLIRDHDFNPNNIIFSGSDEDVLTVLEESIGLENLHRASTSHRFADLWSKSFAFNRSKTKLKSSSCRKGLASVAGCSNEDEIISPTISPKISPKMSPTISPTISSTISPPISPTISSTISPTISPTMSSTLSPILSPRKPPPPFKVTPFFLEEQSATKKMFAAWSPERVILFGRAGSGKSTLAQMLTTGKVSLDSSRFKVGAGLRGQTKVIERNEGRGWYVVDTPGFGEPRGPQSTISTEEVERTLKRFIDLVQGTFAHYIFVVKKDRVDQLDVNLWNFFRLLFGKEICYQFSIVVSDADEEWMAQNSEYLRKSFQGCSSFKWALFPTTDEKDGDLLEDPADLQGLREENESVASDSLDGLERELARLARCERPCDYGKESRISRLMEQERASSDMKLERSLRIKMIAQGSEILCRMEEVFSSLVHCLQINDKIALVPLEL